jgi:hypothetical protein
MDTLNFKLPASYSDGLTPYDAGTIERLHLIVDSQLGAVLQSLGEGVLRSPNADSFLVSSGTGLNVQVSPGLANVQKDGVFSCLELKTSVSVNTEPNRDETAPLYLFAAFYEGEDGRDDSFETLLPLLVWGDAPVMNGGVPLARVTTTNNTVSVVDIRSMIGTSQLQSDLGYDEAERAKGTVAARLGTLETSPSGGAGAGNVAFLGQLHFTAQEDRDAITVLNEQMDAKIASAVGAIVPGRRAVKTPIDLMVHEHQITRGEVGIVEATLVALMEELLTPAQIEAFAQRGLTVRPRIVERSQSATIGPNFGSGENDTPDFEGEGAGKNADGTFGVAQ